MFFFVNLPFCYILESFTWSDAPLGHSQFYTLVQNLSMEQTHAAGDSWQVTERGKDIKSLAITIITSGIEGVRGAWAYTYRDNGGIRLSHFDAVSTIHSRGSESLWKSFLQLVFVYRFVLSIDFCCCFVCVYWYCLILNNFWGSWTVTGVDGHTWVHMQYRTLYRSS